MNVGVLGRVNGRLKASMGEGRGVEGGRRRQTWGQEPEEDSGLCNWDASGRDICKCACKKASACEWAQMCAW